MDFFRKLRSNDSNDTADDQWILPEEFGTVSQNNVEFKQKASQYLTALSYGIVCSGEVTFSVKIEQMARETYIGIADAASPVPASHTTCIGYQYLFSGYAFCLTHGGFYHNEVSGGDPVGAPFNGKYCTETFCSGAVIDVKVDIDNGTLCYYTKGRQLGEPVDISLPEDHTTGVRLAVTALHGPAKFTLLSGFEDLERVDPPRSRFAAESPGSSICTTDIQSEGEDDEAKTAKLNNDQLNILGDEPPLGEHGIDFTPAAAAAAESVPTPAFLDTVVSKWSEHDVCQWIASMSPALKSYTTLFRQNAINGKVLISMNKEELEDIGIRNKFHRRRIHLELVEIKAKDLK